MALSGNERVHVVGVIGGGPAAVIESVSTQQIANLRTGGSTPLTGNEVISVRGPSPNGSISPVPFNTTSHAIGSLGSIAVSTLTGKEIVLVGPIPGPASSLTYAYEQVTTLQIANA